MQHLSTTLSGHSWQHRVLVSVLGFTWQGFGTRVGLHEKRLVAALCRTQPASADPLQDTAVPWQVGDASCPTAALRGLRQSRYLQPMEDPMPERVGITWRKLPSLWRAHTGADFWQELQHMERSLCRSRWLGRRGEAATHEEHAGVVYSWRTVPDGKDPGQSNL